jgi:hypothetical protein
MRRRMFAVLVLFAGAGWMFGQSAAPQAGKPADPWAKLNFLIGEWTGVGSGAPGEATGGTTFAFGLDKSILARTNRAQYPPQPGQKTGLLHEDLMYVYFDAGSDAPRAVYFDNEKHVIHYLVAFPSKPDAVAFESDPAAKGPRYRMTYELNADKTLKTVFFIAPPGRDFKPYVEGTLKRK